MAEVAAAIGLVSAIQGFVTAALQIIKTLEDMRRNIGVVPKTFQDLYISLPLLADTLKRTSEKVNHGQVNLATQAAVRPVVDACCERVKELNAILVKLIPKEDDSYLRRWKKASETAFRYQDEVGAIEKRLRDHVQLLTYHESTGVGPLQLPRKETPVVLIDIPFSRDQNFIGCSEELERLGNGFAKKQRLALVGIGGVGKTQIAVELCYRYKALNPGHSILWVHASTASRIEQGFRKIARELKLPGLNDPALDAMQLVLDWFHRPDTPEWLLVWDNADDIDLFFSTGLSNSTRPSNYFKYLPKDGSGRVLVTSRDRRVGQRLCKASNVVPVRELDIKDAVKMLRSKLPEDCSDDDQILSTLAAEIDCLPLALTQAAAFISETMQSVDTYLELLRDRDEAVALLEDDRSDERRDSEDLEQSNSVVKTWKVSFDRLTEHSPQAANLLSLMSLFDRHAVPKVLLQDERLSAVKFIQAMESLQSLHFVNRMAHPDTFEMHRIVQTCVQRWLLLQNSLSRWQSKALDRVFDKFPFPSYETWAICEQLWPHASMVSNFQVSTAENRRSQSILWHRMGCWDEEQGRLQDSHKKISTSLEWLLKDSPQDPMVLHVKHSLAVVLRDQGKTKEAEMLFEQVWQNQSTKVGPHRYETIRAKSELAKCYLIEQRLQEAVDLHTRCFEDSKKMFGMESQSTTLFASDLGMTLLHNGDLEKAEPLLKRNLGIVRRIWGDQHPVTLAGMLLLSAAHMSRDMWKEALAMMSPVYNTLVRLFGENNQRTLWARSHLANVYFHTGKFDEAVYMQREILRQVKDLYGRRHGATLCLAIKLADTYRWMDSLEDSEKMAKGVVLSESRDGGPLVSSALYAIANGSLALTHCYQERWQEAELRAREYLNLGKTIFGEEHIETYTATAILAVVLHSTGREDEAVALLAKAEAGRVGFYGSRHPWTEHTMKELASWKAQQAASRHRRNQDVGDIFHLKATAQRRSLSVDSISREHIKANREVRRLDYPGNVKVNSIDCTWSRSKFMLERPHASSSGRLAYSATATSVQKWSMISLVP